MSKLGSIVDSGGEDITVDRLKELFPERKNSISDKHVELLKDSAKDAAFSTDIFMKELVTYKSIMKDGSLSFNDYVRAVKFIAYLPEAEWNATEAYKKAMANDKFVLERVHAPTDSNAYKELTNQASRFQRLPHVRQLQAQVDLPEYVMLAGTRMQMMQVLVTEAMTAAYSKDRISAAKAVVENTKPPENKTLDVTLGVSDDVKSAQERISEQMESMIDIQMREYNSGKSLDEVQKLNVVTDIIDVETVDNE